MCGMAIAVIAHKSAEGVSECGWYLVVYLMDCTMGITLAITFHRLMHKAAKWHHMRVVGSRERQDHEHPWSEALLESGNYGDPPNMKRWAVQAAGWVTCVVTARLSVGATVLSTLGLMARVAGALDGAFVGKPNAELFTVMVGIPMLLNVGQAWIQDQVLKWSARRRIKRGGSESLNGMSDAPVLVHSHGGLGGMAGAGGLMTSGELYLPITAGGRNRAASDKTPLLAAIA